MSSKKSIAENELARLIEIQKNLSSDIVRGVASYGMAKCYANYFERLSRKYKINPSELGIRKKTGTITKIPKVR